MCNIIQTHDATPSWYGYEFQGRLGMQVFLSRLNEVDIDKIGEYILEFEHIEDFSIIHDNTENDVEKYESIYQVKAREGMSKEDVEEVLVKLAIKKLDMPTVDAFLIATCDIPKVDISEELSKYICIMIEECNRLTEYSEINTIKENLNLKKKGDLENIKKIIRSEIQFKDIDIKIIHEIANNLSAKLEELQQNISKVVINNITRIAEEVNEELKQQIEKLLIKLGICEVYKFDEEAIDKKRNALLHLLNQELEKHIDGGRKTTFRINGNKIIKLMEKDDSHITRLHWLYLIRESYYRTLMDYCEVCDFYKQEECIECNLNNISQIILQLDYSSLEEILFNSNPDVKRGKLDFDSAKQLIESGKLTNYVFNELKLRNYKFNDINSNTYIKRGRNKELLSFINQENKKFLLNKLDKNISGNYTIFNDNKEIINKNLDFIYVKESTHIINQHWDDEELKENYSNILKSGILFKSISNLEDDKNAK